ncbi:N-acetyltransferase [Vallitalea longa]|uniref:N-acetyltransferase n=1 Tax=Vallitalea longa TaxID=2936439 RepID=A0A9W5YGH6_9FIRM|nr:GNAT family N-acetyltransferase [Vallitalea longa]GKX30763.1 N-acetyltransferase [Vallitalea longa]
MDIEIKMIEYGDIIKAMKLIEEVFNEFVAHDYTQKGIKTFKEEFINNDDFIDKFSDGREKMYGAYVGEQLAGVLSISNHNTISCIFVKKEFHRMGIGTRLINRIIEEVKNSGVRRIRLNASLYAVPFYHAVGFDEMGDVCEYKGIKYMPMELDILQ